MSEVKEGVIVGDDGTRRCWWCGEDGLYRDYHDQEWGFPVTDDRRLFEKLCLEGFQAGLSWLTILRKRENFRAAFDGFDIERVAAYDASDVERPARLTRGALSEMATTPASKRLAKELKARGFKFVGPTTAYAFMQAMGLVNDHLEGCETRQKVEEA